MEKKIAALQAAYAARDAAKVRKCAAALVAYDRKHMMASLCNMHVNASEVVALAKRIVSAPVLPF